MKNYNAKCLLHKFFNLCFKSGLSHVDWDLSNIKPIPKKDKGARDPLQNRCITIMCCVAKVYSKILNTRIQKYLESNKILVEEQNGFRACRSCIDHLYLLCNFFSQRVPSKWNLLPESTRQQNTVLGFKAAYDGTILRHHGQL